jgi:hypothetical protein
VLIIRAWDDFGSGGVAYDRGIINWGRGVDEELPVLEGDELHPYESVGFVSVGGFAKMICVPSFGTVRRLLVADGEEVRPGQPLLEFEPRDPTLDEWAAQWERANRMRHEIWERDQLLDSPARALLTSLRRRLRR